MDNTEKSKQQIEKVIQAIKRILIRFKEWQVPDIPKPATPSHVEYKEINMKPLFGHIENFYAADEIKGIPYLCLTLFFIILSMFFMFGRVWLLAVFSVYLAYKFILKSWTFLSPVLEWKKEKRKFAKTNKKYSGRVIGVERVLHMEGGCISSWPEATYRLRVGFVKDGKLKIITTPEITISPDFSSPISCVVYEYNKKYIVNDFFPCAAVLANDDSDLSSFAKRIDIPLEYIDGVPGANIAFVYGEKKFVAHYIENVHLVEKDSVHQILLASSEYDNVIPCLIAPDGEFSAEAISLAQENNVLLIYRKMLKDMDMKSIILQFVAQNDKYTIQYLYKEPSQLKYWTLADLEQRYGIPRQHILLDFERAGLPKEKWNGIGPYVYQSKAVINWEKKTGFVKLISTGDGIIKIKPEKIGL